MSGNSSKGWVSHRTSKHSDESHKLSVKAFSRIKSNSSLKSENKNLKKIESQKAIGPKNGNPTNSYQELSKMKFDGERKGKEKHYQKIKEYMNRNSLKNNSEQLIMKPKKQVKHSDKPENVTFGVELEDEQILKEEENKNMKRKKLSIQIPDGEDSLSTHDRSHSSVPVYSTVGPHRSVSVQNRTTTITQFSTLNDKENDNMMNFVPSRVEEDIPLKSGREIIVLNFESTKTSVRGSGVVAAYAANTHQGIVRNYNEDRVSIILNIVKPPSRKNENWPK